MNIYDSISVGQILTRGADQVPDKIALVDGNQRTTYKELNDMANALAASLAEIGFQKGDRAAIYMKNSLELVAAFYALQKIGVIAVWVNALYRVSEAEHILGNSEARGVFIFDEWQGNDYLNEILSLKNRLPHLESIILAGQAEGPDVYSYDDLVEKGTKSSPPPVDIDPLEDLAISALFAPVNRCTDG
ncbi:MAG: AMP-binding protein [Desulfobacterales bacterium]